MPSRGLRLFVRGMEPRHRAVRGLPVEVPADGPFSLWGEVFNAMILNFLCLCIFSCNGLSHARSSLFRLKRTLEQAQPSMTKRLKVGAAPKSSGQRFIPNFVLALCWLLWQLFFAIECLQAPPILDR